MSSQFRLCRLDKTMVYLRPAVACILPRIFLGSFYSPSSCTDRKILLLILARNSLNRGHWLLSLMPGSGFLVVGSCWFAYLTGYISQAASLGVYSSPANLSWFGRMVLAQQSDLWASMMFRNVSFISADSLVKF